MREASVDVVLLNSDTVVTGGWLDALVPLRTIGRGDQDITPFSNNPDLLAARFCENSVADGVDPEPLARGAALGAAPSIPTCPPGWGSACTSGARCS
jgi:hypothetical protein